MPTSKQSVRSHYWTKRFPTRSLRLTTTTSAVREWSPETRSQHNVMERWRRSNLKSDFGRLRDTIPFICGNRRVSKVAILRRAVEHIHKLTAIYHVFRSERIHQRAVQQQLKSKLSDAQQAAVRTT